MIGSDAENASRKINRPLSSECCYYIHYFGQKFSSRSISNFTRYSKFQSFHFKLKSEVRRERWLGSIIEISAPKFRACCTLTPRPLVHFRRRDQPETAQPLKSPRPPLVEEWRKRGRKHRRDGNAVGTKGGYNRSRGSFTIGGKDHMPNPS